jgi:hypothetical protein
MMGLPSKRALVKLWRHRRPDPAHGMTEGPQGWSAGPAAATVRLRVCSDFRTNFHSDRKRRGLDWLHRPILAYLRMFHNKTRIAMVPTEALRRQSAGEGFHKLKVVARGVYTLRFNPLKPSEALWCC